MEILADTRPVLFSEITDIMQKSKTSLHSREFLFPVCVLPLLLRNVAEGQAWQSKQQAC